MNGPAGPPTSGSTGDPEEAARLIAALPRVDDKALWGTALYAGLRRGELRGLPWQDVDTASGVIRVERAMDDSGAVIAPKSAAGTRTVPVAAELRDLLLDWKMACAWSGREDGYVFGSSSGQPFTASAVRRRALTAWNAATEKDAEEAEREGRKPNPLTPIGLHESRHTAISMWIAAGINIKACSVFAGHSSITITLDRYGHLMPGNEEEAAGLLDAYLVRANTSARLVQVART